MPWRREAYLELMTAARTAQPLLVALTGPLVRFDSRLPTDARLEAYCYYVDTGREILGLPPGCSGGEDSGRMVS